MQDFEIIVVDDCSSGDIISVVNSFSDHRIRLIRHNECKGGSASRNTGIASSQGEFVAFLDDDDEWCRDKLEIQLDFMDRHRELSMVYTGYFLITQNTGRIKEVNSPRKRQDLAKCLLRENVIGTTSTVMIRRACLTSGNIKFDETLRSCQDWDVYLKIISDYQIDCISEPLARHYEHNERITERYADVIQGHRALMEKIHQKYIVPKKVTAHHHYKIAKLFLQFGDHEKGRHELLRSREKYPWYPSAYVYLAASYLKTSDYRHLSVCWQVLKSIRSRFFSLRKTN
jgi:glycosyltransferase involved in cell wall biosynthesis